jgi:preprotein translocase subunit YajC
MDISLLLPLFLLLFAIPIFLSGRKQRAQFKEMQKLQSELEPGDVVVTTSGLRGTVVDASYEETVDIEIADGVVTTWVRAAVRQKVEHTAEEAAESSTEGVEESPKDEASVEEKPSLEKGDSTNGAARA